MTLTEAGSSRQWRTLRALILERDAHQCMIHGPGCTGVATTVDHIQPRQLGGTDTAANLRASCKKCNYSRRHGTAAVQSRW